MFDSLYDATGDTRQTIGFGLGIASIICWMVAQVPQLVKNYKAKSADALSPVFLAEWLLGDTLNLLGALLTKDQPATVVLTAQYFICMDCILLLQYLYYSSLARRRERTYSLSRRRDHRHHHHHRSNGAGSGHHHHHHTSRALRSRHHDPSLVDPQLVVIDQQQAVAAVPVAGGTTLTTTEVASTTLDEVQAIKSISGAGVPGILVGGSTTSKLRLAAGAVAATTVLFIGQGRQGKPLGGAASFFVDVGSSSRRRRRLFGDAVKSVASTAMEKRIGTGLGYASCLMYLSSRMFQIYKNYKRRSAKGLALSMFFCAIAANLLYGFGILVRSRSSAEIMTSLPWILGSLGTVSLDMVILAQGLKYGDGPEEKHGSDEEESLLDNVEGQHEIDG